MSAPSGNADGGAVRAVPPVNGHSLTVTLPTWVHEHVQIGTVFTSDTARSRLAVGLARENVARRTGGPFGAAVFEERSGRLVAVGVNLVRAAGQSVLHAEVVAMMFAQHVLGTHELNSSNGPSYTLATSCAPCAMCLGAIHWSGIRRVITAALREDAMAIGFDEGPVFPESIRYLEATGMTFSEGVEREAGRAVLDEYLRSGGVLYNG